MRTLRRVLLDNRERNASANCRHNRAIAPRKSNSMTYEGRAGLSELEHGTEVTARRLRPDQPILNELIKVLAPHPGGLRRWSVMRAIRKDRENSARDIPQKFEDEVERIFRRFCTDADDAKTSTCVASETLFYRPREKAGEVWAIFPDHAKAWLDAEPAEVN